MLFTWKAREIHMVVVLFYCGTAIYNKSLKFQSFSRMLANVKNSQMYLIIRLSLFFADLSVLCSFVYF